MKIGFVSREYPPLTHVGGIATYTSAAAKLLADRGHQVHVVCHGGTAEVSAGGGITVHRVPMLPHHFPSARLLYPYRAWYRRALPHYLDALTWARTAARYLRSGLDPTAFDAWEFPETAGEGAFLPIRSGPGGPRMVCRIHSGWTDACADNMLERSRLLGIQRRACLRADLVVSPSRFMAGAYARRTLGLDGEVKVSRNPLALWEAPIQWSSKRACHLLYVGRVEHRKGLQVLLKALDSLGPEGDGITLRVVGHVHPPTRAEDAECQALFGARLRERALPARGGYALEYAGPCAHGEMHRHYDWAGALVIPSLMENYPYAALEGLSRGCFLIGSEVGGIPEIIDRPGRGALFPSENSALLARKIRECRQRDRELPESMREAADGIRAEFAPETCAERLLETYGPNLPEGHR